MMKKNHQMLSRKRSLRLRAKIERKSKKLILLANLKRAYKRLRSNGHSSQLSVGMIKRAMSKDELDVLADIIEKMFAPRESVIIRYFGH